MRREVRGGRYEEGDARSEVQGAGKDVGEELLSGFG